MLAAGVIFVTVGAIVTAIGLAVPDTALVNWTTHTQS